MTDKVTVTVDAIIDSLNTPTPYVESRYPNLYAYDFFRSHLEWFGLSGVGPISRADAAGLVRSYAELSGQDHRTVLYALADGYLREFNLYATVSQCMGWEHR